MTILIRTIKLGFSRGWIETKNSLLNPGETIYLVFMHTLLLLILYLNKEKPIRDFPLISFEFPGLLIVSLLYNSFFSLAARLAADRDDGTILRAKILPGGIATYLISRVVYSLLISLVGMTFLICSSCLFFDNIHLTVPSVAFWLFILLLGALSFIPLAITIGLSVKLTSFNFVTMFFLLAGIVSLSGIIYPIMNPLMQKISQIFPVYWLSLGLRVTMLPKAAVALDTSNYWKICMITIPMLWSIIGSMLAIPALKKAVEKQSTSEIYKRKEESIARGY